MPDIYTPIDKTSFMRFEKLFEPIYIGEVRIKNRVAMAPMGIRGLIDTDGGPTQRAVDYYVERAFGGVGLITTGVTTVTTLEPGLGVLSVSAGTASAFSQLAEAVHYYGTRLFVQLTAGFGRVLFPRLIDRGLKPMAPSALPSFWRPRVTTKALATEEVEAIVQAIGSAAELLKSAGVDGVEFHGHEGYLFDQFATALWNKRTDKYGGVLADRLTFSIEALNAVKNKAGKDFPVVYRFGLKHYLKGAWSAALPGETFVEAGRDVPEGLEMASLLEKAGFDALHVDAGCYDSWYWSHPPNYQPHGCLVDMPAQVKKVVKIPVIAVGRLDIPELAEKVLEDGKADIIALGRGLLADPHWVKKVHQGKLDEIRPCNACRDACGYRIMYEHRPLGCSVNPAIGREGYHLRRVEKPTKVVIAGGGAAGMEAARVAATRGCKVILYERNERLGGHLIPASVPQFKEDVGRLLKWYERQLKSLNVEIRMGVTATPELIKQEEPDKVIVATGSTPIVPSVPGNTNPLVATCIDLLLGKKTAGEKVVVIGGGLVGCETALWLASQDKKVTVIELLPELATGMFGANRELLLSLLAAKRVQLITNACLDRVADDGMDMIEGQAKRTIKCDTVALALGLQSNSELYESLKRDITELYIIGDCKEPRNIRHAIWDGYYVASR